MVSIARFTGAGDVLDNAVNHDRFWDYGSVVQFKRNYISFFIIPVVTFIGLVFNVQKLAGTGEKKKTSERK